MIINRKDKIKEYITKHGSVTIDDLMELCPEVSSMTIRRDLVTLEREGHIQRIRGGACMVPQYPEQSEDVFSSRVLQNTEAKNIIAKKAMEFVETGRSIFIDSGTTTTFLAKMMPNSDYSIITSSPNIGMEITLANPNPRVTLIGGQLNRNNLTAAGNSSINFLKNINIDIAFMAASGFSLKSGFTNGDYNECELKKTVIRKAGKVVMLMDISKLDKNLPYTFATLKDVDILIIDGTLPEEYRKAAEKYGSRII